MSTQHTSQPSQHNRSNESSTDPNGAAGSTAAVLGPDAGPFYHGTKADLAIGATITVGHRSNYGSRRTAKYVYMTATLEAAIWGAELAEGDGRERIYVVEPSGPFENDPNLTDKKFPGNPTRSYRTAHPLRVVGTVDHWQGHTAEQLGAMRDGLQRLRDQGIEAIEE